MGFYRSFYDFRVERHANKWNPRYWDSELFEIEEDGRKELVSTSNEWIYQEYLIDHDGMNYDWVE